MTTRRAAALLLAAAALVAGCAAEDADTAEVATPASTASTASKDVTSSSAPTDSAPGAQTNAPTTDAADAIQPASKGSRTACSPRTQAEAGEPVTVPVWHFASGRAKELLVQFTAEFELAHPNVDIELVPQTGADASITAWQSLSDPSARPALMLLSEDYTGAMAADPATLNFTGCLTNPDQGELIPAIEGTYSLDGELLAAPFVASTPLLYLDAIAFRNAGLDPNDPPETLDELRAVAQTIVDTGTAPTGVVLELELFSGGSWYVEQWMAQQAAPSLDADNGRTGEPTTVLWDDEVALDGLAHLDSMIDDGLAIVIDDPSGFDDFLLIADVDSTERGVMAIQTSGSLAELTEANAAFPGVELAVGPLPGPGVGSLVGGSAWWMSNASPDAVTSAAFEFVEFLASSPVQAEIAANTGYVPIRAEALDEPVLADLLAEWPQYAVGPAQLMATGTEPARLLPVAQRRPEIREVLVGAVNSILVDGADPKTTMNEAVRRANEML